MASAGSSRNVLVMNCAGFTSGGRSPRRSVVLGNTIPYSTFSSASSGTAARNQVAQRVGVLPGLNVRLRRQVTAVGHELPVAQLHPVALDLDDGDAFAGVSEHDVDLVVTPIGHQPDVGEHQPVVAEVIAQRLDDRSLLVVRQRPQREVVGHEESHGVSLLVGDATRARRRRSGTRERLPTFGRR